MARGSSLRSCGCWSRRRWRNYRLRWSYSLSIGAHSADAVRLILQARQEQPVGLFCLNGHPHLQGVHVPLPDLTAYHTLRVGA